MLRRRGGQMRPGRRRAPRQIAHLQQAEVHERAAVVRVCRRQVARGRSQLTLRLRRRLRFERRPRRGRDGAVARLCVVSHGFVEREGLKAGCAEVRSCGLALGVLCGEGAPQRDASVPCAPPRHLKHLRTLRTRTLVFTEVGMRRADGLERGQGSGGGGRRTDASVRLQGYSRWNSSRMGRRCWASARARPSRSPAAA